LVFGRRAVVARAAPLTLELEHRADGTCGPSDAVRYKRGDDCITKDLEVTTPGGPVSARLVVSALQGCPAIPVLVRTKPVGASVQSHYSFTTLVGAPGAPADKQLTRNLDPINPVVWQSPAARLSINLEADYRGCDGMSAFKVRVTFPSIADPSPASKKTSKAKRSTRCTRARSALRKARRAESSARRSGRRAKTRSGKRRAAAKLRKAKRRSSSARKTIRRRC
jgi:hypothetical protein